LSESKKGWWILSKRAGQIQEIRRKESGIRELMNAKSHQGGRDACQCDVPIGYCQSLTRHEASVRLSRVPFTTEHLMPDLFYKQGDSISVRKEDRPSHQGGKAHKVVQLGNVERRDVIGFVT
jgi:hypothetical protein